MIANGPDAATGVADSTTPVFVALSGGVDSAVAAHLLRDQYANLTGISHRHWPESRCCSTECLDRCAEQCATLGIPYVAVDCIVEFAQQIVDNFVAGYERGITPNPCVLCNETIRFGLMVEKHFRDREGPAPADYKIATGHYARVEQRDERFHLMRARDASRDQSYMLHRLSQDELAHCLFPLGDLLKTDVRDLAQNWNLQAAKVADSQDVCFVADRYQDFIDQYSENVQAPGPFVDTAGRAMGEHKGIAYYTRGQRSGLGLHGGPWYVLRTDAQSNSITLGRREDLCVSAFEMQQLRWVYAETDSMAVDVQTRYRGADQACRFTRVADDALRVDLDAASGDVTPGQSAVFYAGDDVVGGGIITRIGAV